MAKRKDIPNYNSPIIETHCHLDYLEPAVDSIVDEASSFGVERIITISVSKDNLDTVKKIAQEHNKVWGTQGIHPHEAQDFTNDTLAKIKTNLTEQDKLIAVGEIGLDYFYEHSERDVQIKAFESQLELAAELDLPVVIHTREADEDTQAILKNAAPQLKKKGVIHSFTSGKNLAEFCLDQGFYLGFNGISTFKKAENVREIIEITPIEQIVLETDAPYLTPVPYRGKENAPKYLPFIAEQVANTKQIDIQDCLAQCYQNSMNLFFANN